MLQKLVTYVHSNLSHHLVVLNSEMEGLHYVNIGKMQITANGMINFTYIFIAQLFNKKQVR